MLRRASLLGLVAVGLTSCSLYFGDGDDEGGGDDTPPLADASIVLPDARPPGECETSEEAALEGLSSCMAMEGWESAGLCGLGSMNTAEGPCYSCHADGTGGIRLASDCAATFEAMKTWPSQNDLVTARADEAGCLTGFDVGLVCGGDGLPEGHVPYVCPTSLADALQQYLDNMFSAWENGSCGPPDAGP